MIFLFTFSLMTDVVVQDYKGEYRHGTKVTKVPLKVEFSLKIIS